MNWTGGQLRRIKSVNTSSGVKLQERSNQLLYIQRKETNKLVDKDFKQITHKKSDRKVFDQKIHSNIEPKTQLMQRNVTKSDDIRNHHSNDSKKYKKRSEDYIKNESEEKYFQEVVHQLVWKYSTKDVKQTK